MRVFSNTAEPNDKMVMKVTTPDGLGEHSKLTIDITFWAGEAEVPDPVGKWMIDTGRARATRMIIHEVRHSGLILP